MLHHYTPPGGLLGIARSRSLWATSIRYLNDTTEYLHAVHLARALRRQMEGLSAREVGFFDYLLGELEFLADVHLYSAGIDHFVVSLTTEADRLSQWRAYGGRVGYCIGWERSAIETLASRNAFGLHQCVYDVERQREMIRPVLEQSLSEFRELDLKLDFQGNFWAPTLEEEVKEWTKLLNLQNKFDDRFGQVATLCKNPAFIEEQEWRLVGGIYGRDGRARVREFREGRTQIIPYVSFDMSDISTLDDPKERQTAVVIGPNPETILASRSVGDMFARFGWPGVRMTASSVPYREW